MVLFEPPYIHFLRTTIKLNAYISVLGSSSIRNDITVPRPLPVSSFGVFTMSIPNIDWFTDHLQSSTTTNSLMKHSLNGTAVTVSDELYFPLSEVGICTWIISTHNGELKADD